MFLPAIALYVSRFSVQNLGSLVYVSTAPRMLTHQYQKTDRFRYVETVLKTSTVVAALDVSNISDSFTMSAF